MSTARRRSTSSPWTRSSASDSTGARGGPRRPRGPRGPPPPRTPPVPPRPDRCAPRSCQPLLDLAPHERLDGGEGDLDRLAHHHAPRPPPAGAPPAGHTPRGGA